MCAGAIYWAGVRRLVYGIPGHDLKRFTGDYAENTTLDLRCRVVFTAGQWAVEVVGLMLLDESSALNLDVWKKGFRK